MNKYLVAFIVALSVLVIVLGKYQYNQKLTNIASSAQQLLAETELFAETEDVEGIEDKTPQNNSEDDESKNLEDNLQGLLQDVPPALAGKIETKLTANEGITILAFGSQALTDSQNDGLVPWPELFMEKINEAYSTDLFTVETMSVGEMTSVEMIQQKIHQEVAEKNADIFLIEPLIWNDNGEVIIEQSTEYLAMLIDRIGVENEEAVSIVQPSQPAYNTVNYPIQIEGLRNYANEHDYLYIDHWSDWPDLSDEELIEYVDEDSPRVPTQKGHEQWSESVLSMFVN